MENSEELQTIIVAGGRRGKKIKKKNHGDAKCRKRAPRSIEFNFFINCDRHKRFSQNERRRADLQKAALDFLIFAQGLSYDLSKFSDIFTPFFRL